MLYARREKLEKFSIRIGVAFSKLGVSPNQWTLLTLVPALISLYFIINQSFLLAALFMIAATFIDVIDGAVARVTGRVTKLGAYLDTIMDRYVEGIIILGLLFLTLPVVLLPSQFWIGLLIFGSLMTTYVKAAAKEKELVEKELKGGLLERAERMLIIFIGIVLAYFDITYLVYVIILVAILSNISSLQRIYYAMKKSKY
ncbi:MAG: CDP-alcohol phosphatidyltransferase family protein [Candidatus Aenigmarchaeota archaeon]|nr:CDP-alcohol phosphatidyltransferase family protein [Candidatus Aenigmarchaeota archaeon]